ncbi:MAG: PIN domain-containing protein [Salinibacter sp.]
MTIVVDTSAWIEFYHPQGDPAVQATLADALEGADVATLAPVAVELLTGVQDESAYRTIQDDLDALIPLPIDDRVGRQAAAWSWRLAREGRRVPTVDLLIAGAAHVHGAELWHYGDVHFAAIADVDGLAERNLQATSS